MNVRKSIPNRSVHAYHKIYVVWGKKPEEKECTSNSTPEEKPSEIKPDHSKPTKDVT